MREIKFRGKAIMSVEELEDDLFIEHENGWLTGNLIHNKGRPWIVGDIVESDPEYIAHEFWLRVYPKSVGQYTGLKDKNGKEIYEGDIVRCCAGGYWNGVYEFDNIIEVKDIRDLNAIIYSEYVEILGNKFENPDINFQGSSTLHHQNNTHLDVERFEKPLVKTTPQIKGSSDYLVETLFNSLITINTQIGITTFTGVINLSNDRSD